MRAAGWYGAAFVGKGVRGAAVLGEEHFWNTKFLRVESKYGPTVDIDFRKSGRGASTARLIDEHGDIQLEFELNSDPYYTFLDAALDFDGELDTTNLDSRSRPGRKFSK